MRFSILIFLSFAMCSAQASTGIFLKGKDQTGYYGIATGLFRGIKGAFFLNGRNTVKTGESFRTGATPVQWTSNYASLTFNPFGKEFPFHGVNEHGLIVQAAQAVEGEPPNPQSGIPTLYALQWPQYILDMAKDLDEAIAFSSILQAVSFTGGIISLQICDASNKCGVIEYVGGEQKVTTNESLPYPVISNGTYSRGTQWVSDCIRASKCNPSPIGTLPGGGVELPNDLAGFDVLPTNTHYQRFITAAKSALSFDNSTTQPIDYLKSVLVAVDQGPKTSWNMIYHRKEPHLIDVHFRGNPVVDKNFRTIQVDFRAGTINDESFSLECAPFGSRPAYFFGHSVAENSAHREIASIIKLAFSREPYGEWVGDTFIRYPTTTRCL